MAWMHQNRFVAGFRARIINRASRINSAWKHYLKHAASAETLGYYRHEAQTTQCPMEFTVFVPPEADRATVPVLWWLSGLTCTADNFTTKAGAYRMAAELGLMIVAPDTSPRGDDVPNDEAYDLGQGAGFYLDATASPWSTHFNMYSYVTSELPAEIFAAFPGDARAQGITGHSMGGHGALTIGLKNPATYRSMSAFAPIVNPCECPWGQKAFGTYLGDDQTAWSQYDATRLVAAAGDRSAAPEILIDQGRADGFLTEQLMPGAICRCLRKCPPGGKTAYAGWL